MWLTTTSLPTSPRPGYFRRMLTSPGTNKSSSFYSSSALGRQVQKELKAGIMDLITALWSSWRGSGTLLMEGLSVEQEQAF